MFFEIISSIVNAIIQLTTLVVLIFWATYELSSKKTRNKMILLLEDIYDLVDIHVKKLHARAITKVYKKPKLEDLFEEVDEKTSLILDRIKELEKKEFDSRLRIVLKDKNIIDDEFDGCGECEECQYSDKYFSYKGRR